MESMLRPFNGEVCGRVPTRQTSRLQRVSSVLPQDGSFLLQMSGLLRPECASERTDAQARNSLRCDRSGGRLDC